MLGSQLGHRYAKTLFLLGKSQIGKNGIVLHVTKFILLNEILKSTKRYNYHKDENIIEINHSLDE
jgi:hypothetical protein